MSLVINLSLLLAAIALFSFLLYRSLIPTPIPGIPFSRSALRPLGDAPGFVKFHSETGTAAPYFANKCRELQSPIVQIFIALLEKPLVVITDHATTEDILTRRTAEFDISKWFTGVFEAVIPNSHVHLSTNEGWRRQRRSVSDIMSGHFLQNVAASRAYESCVAMTELWDEKIRVGGGRTFSSIDDIEQMMLDAIWGVAFGSSIGSTQAQMSLLKTLQKLPSDNVDTDNGAVAFPTAPNPAVQNTLFAIAESHMIPITSPFGSLHHKLAFQLDPKLRKAKRKKDVLLTERLNAAAEKVRSEKPSQTTCAADLLLQREKLLADKENRRPVYDTPVIRDELYALLQAGSDTTSTTLKWGLKYLTAHQDVQTKLRASLHQAFGTQALPTALQIATTNIPYLEATVQEALRLAGTAPIVARSTRKDCEILGHTVPAKTNVLMITSGPSYCDSPFKLQSGSVAEKQPESDRMSQDTATGDSAADSLSQFKPERWLRDDEAGETRFVFRACPAHAMGTGPRHCFGKPMATLFLRIFITVIIYTFDLENLPQGLEEFNAIQRLTHMPKTVNMRLRKRLEHI